jgi:2-iminobutanoate/2-iminopropanoate deaminase
MTREIIKPAGAPVAVGPYNQAVKANGFVFTAGQIPLDPVSGAVVGTDIKAQTEQVLKNLQAVLKGAGTSFDNAVKMTVFLKDMNDFAGMNEVYATFIKAENAPARSTIQVARLPKDALVEIEAVAVI